MASNVGDGKGSSLGKTFLHKGLKTRAPAAVDKSFSPARGSVNSETTRKETAPTPKTLGPRSA